MNSPYLIGDKVYLRALTKSDAPTIVPWINDPEVTRTILHRPPINLETEEQFIERATKEEHSLILGIVVKATDQLIGATGLDQVDFRNRHARFGIVIGDKPSWGHGYGSEATSLVVAHAFQTLNLNRVWLHVFEYNECGIRIYEKLGFRREGMLRQDNYRDGRYWDTIVMAVLREEWTARDHEEGG